MVFILPVLIPGHLEVRGDHKTRPCHVRRINLLVDSRSAFSYLLDLLARPAYILYQAVKATRRPSTPPILFKMMLGSPMSSVRRLARARKSHVKLTRMVNPRNGKVPFIEHIVTASEKMKNPCVRSQ